MERGGGKRSFKKKAKNGTEWEDRSSTTSTQNGTDWDGREQNDKKPKQRERNDLAEGPRSRTEQNDF